MVKGRRFSSVQVDNRNIQDGDSRGKDSFGLSKNQLAAIRA